MKKTFEDNRARLSTKEREQVWGRIADRTIRAGDPAVHVGGDVAPGRSLGDRAGTGRPWRLWAPLTVAAAASVVLVVSLWNQGPTREELLKATKPAPMATDGVLTRSRPDLRDKPMGTAGIERSEGPVQNSTGAHTAAEERADAGSGLGDSGILETDATSLGTAVAEPGAQEAPATNAPDAMRVPPEAETSHALGGKDVESLPVDEIAEAIGQKAGVITKEDDKGSDLHFRGGRSGEIDVDLHDEPVRDPSVGTGDVTAMRNLPYVGRRPTESATGGSGATWEEGITAQRPAADPSVQPPARTKSDRDESGKTWGAIKSLSSRESREDDEDSVPPAPSGAPYDLVYYQNYGSNPLVLTDHDALSTFAVDVDKGAYTVARRYVTDGYLPEPAAVRVEEFVNYFDPGYPEFDDTDFRIYADGAPSPFRKGYELIRVGLQARTVADAKRPPARLIFVVDVSGSMARENRLGLVRHSLGMLLDELRADDQVAIVAYGSTARVVLPPTRALERERIRWGIEELVSGGSTNAEDGLRLGYDLARQMYAPQGINRILLCSDGVANVGRTGPEEILRTVRAESDRGIYLTTIGFGMGNYNDVLMEQLADQGDGAYYYVDRYEEAERVLVRELTGTLLVVARDAKVQVEFDRRAVEAYRLLGFENRDVADRDFRNDEVDAGEIGSGHSVVALYEVKLRDRAERGNGREPLATVRLRYALPERRSEEDWGTRRGRDPEVREISRAVTASDLTPNFQRAPWRFRLAAVVAQYAEILRNSYWAQDDAIADLVPVSSDLAFYLRDDAEVVEFARIVEKAAELQRTMTAQERDARWPRLEARAPDYPARRDWDR